MNNIKDILDRPIVPTSAHLVPQVILSRFLSDLSHLCIDQATSGGITLQTSWRLKEDPMSSASNLRNDNRNEICEEIRGINTENMVVLLDVLPAPNGLSIQGLQSAAQNLDQRTKVTFACSSYAATDAAPDVRVNVKRLRESLLAGFPDNITNASLNARTPAYIKANAIICDFGAPFMAPVRELNIMEHMQLIACGTLHSELNKEVGTSNSIATTHLPPIIISLPPFSTVYEHCLTVLIEAGADISKVVFNQVALSAEALVLWDALLGKYPCSVCVDSWGYSAVFSTMCIALHSHEGKGVGKLPFPADQEMLRNVCSLLRAGFGQQIILSLAIYCKIQLSMYGGYGYSYLHRVISPALVAALTPEHWINDSEVGSTLQSLMGGNLWCLLNWRPAPPVVEIPVDTLECHVCKTRFVPGNHYSKFGKEYCTSKCMAVHRNADWK